MIALTRLSDALENWQTNAEMQPTGSLGLTTRPTWNGSIGSGSARGCAAYKSREARMHGHSIGTVRA
jgi:hypothetical protein